MRNDRLNFFLVMMHKIKDHAITALDAGSATSGSIAKRLLSTSGAVLTLGILVVGNASADTTVTDIVAPWGCSMPHCSPGLSDDTGLESALSNDVIDVWRDTEVNGSFVGPGCVANHNTAVCSFQSTQSKPVEIRAYDVDGIPLWSSEASGNQAFYSAPIIGPDGGVVAVDQGSLVRFGPDGSAIWSQPTAGGTQMRPNVTEDGHIILAATAGPIQAYDYETGDLVAELVLEDSIWTWLEDSIWTRLIVRNGIFDTINNAAIRGNRIYVSTRFNAVLFPSSLGRLYAIDLIQNPDTGYSFEVAWFYQFRSPSGSSPTLGTVDGKTVVYFDGSGATPFFQTPAALAVMDMGNYGRLLWSYPLVNLPQASPALDPRSEGGVWFFAFREPELIRIDEETGGTLQTINVDALIEDAGGPFRPSSVMSISIDSESGNPVGVVAASNPDDSTIYVIAIDLELETLLWKYRIEEGRGYDGGTSGQFAQLIDDQGLPVLVFSTRRNGVWGLVLGP